MQQIYSLLKLLTTKRERALGEREREPETQGEEQWTFQSLADQLRFCQGGVDRTTGRIRTHGRVREKSEARWVEAGRAVCEAGTMRRVG